ncbi:murein transglycosylase [Paramagnetospirillum marisnigri]|uniref:Murein transglycosylase n=1 Tax=Paramagnetospirillum marisnigri TaxID=1285242 RepID=A0A178MQG3_9PROT|nr:murein transglycosylase [Paramagnetospirillum marisnigri]OAN50861.1 murein transglycosylase [Paramagnetospirillum marisnigri]
MMKWRQAWTVVGLTILLLAPVSARAVTPPVNEGICAAEVATAERSYGIPQALLHSISIVESGRYDAGHRAVIAWPWTVMAEGQGRYFPSKAEAVAEVRKLKARGVQNIDVGCMQVNLRYHPTAFANLEEAFEPSANIGYAARFLKGLFDATGHWPTAASYYHSQTPSLAAIYREKLMKVWTGTGANTQLASAAPRGGYKTVPHAPSLKAVPGSQDVEEKRRAWREQTLASRDEATRIAAAYRQARVSEYQMRRARFMEARAQLNPALRSR